VPEGEQTKPIALVQAPVPLHTHGASFGVTPSTWVQAGAENWQMHPAVLECLSHCNLRSLKSNLPSIGQIPLSTLPN
jgi:hypothetical protein